MPQIFRFNPVPWALSIGIVALCLASAYSIANSCTPAKFEFFQLLKTELGGCKRTDVIPSVVVRKPQTSDTPTENPNEEAHLTSHTSLVAQTIEAHQLEIQTPVDISQIHIGNTYYLTNKLHPDLFNAPLHANKPSWGRVAPVIGTILPNQIFSVLEKESTFSGYKWVKVKVSSSTIEGWLPWGANETPFIKNSI